MKKKKVATKMENTKNGKDTKNKNTMKRIEDGGNRVATEVKMNKKGGIASEVSIFFLLYLSSSFEHLNECLFIVVVVLRMALKTIYLHEILSFRVFYSKK
jgi:hypothetical protein